MLQRCSCLPIRHSPVSAFVSKSTPRRFSHGFPPSFTPFSHPAPHSQNIRPLDANLLRFSYPRGCTTLDQPRNVPSPTLRIRIHAPLRDSFTMAAWTCGACTFSNESGMASCEICGTPSVRGSPTRAAAPTAWPCTVCTLVNEGLNHACDACGTAESFRTTLDTTSDKQPVPSSNVSQCAMLASETSDTAFGSPSFAASFEARPRPADDVSPTEKPTKRVKMSEAARGEDIPVRSSIQDPVHLPLSSNSLLAELHGDRLSRRRRAKDGAGPIQSAVSASTGGVGSHMEDTLVILTYNVWFQDVQMQQRMAAISRIIQTHQPHIICLQEVTPAIFSLFQRSPWWSTYTCSLSPHQAASRPYFTITLSQLPILQRLAHPYSNSIMDRDLTSVTLQAGPGRQIMVGNTHLESPCPSPPTWDQMFSEERVGQAKEALKVLEGASNVVFCGDMNWDDGKDGSPPLPLGWGDAWLTLHPTMPGFTYDAKANGMLTGYLRKRLDRVFFRLQDYDLEGIEMVGQEPIANLLYKKERSIKRVKQMVDMPVFPSDHFGLLVTIRNRN